MQDGLWKTVNNKAEQLLLTKRCALVVLMLQGFGLASISYLSYPSLMQP